MFKPLVFGLNKKAGRNVTGSITVSHRVLVLNENIVFRF